MKKWDINIFSRGLRDSLSHCVGPSDSRLLFRRFASSFCIKAPAQPPVTAAVIYTAPSTAPALHITAPAHSPHLLLRETHGAAGSEPAEAHRGVGWALV